MKITMNDKKFAMHFKTKTNVGSNCRAVHFANSASKCSWRSGDILAGGGGGGGNEAGSGADCRDKRTAAAAAAV